MNDQLNRTLIEILPKTELHLHIEGSLEPELLMFLAEKHGVSMPYSSIEEIHQAYQFEDLQSFLDLYYLGASVLIDEDDFYQLMWQYLKRCHADCVVHAEIMFDPQTHTHRGIGFEVFMAGFNRAIAQARDEWGMSVYLIMSYLRHLSEEDAFETLKSANDFLPMIKAAGLDSSEKGNPPEKFTSVFRESANKGLLCVAHAGEEGPASYIWGALDTLNVDRIDHGVRCVEDASLVERLVKTRMPLTVCPLSNVKLRVFNDMSEHNILTLLDKGVCVTVNADDPSYFGGYLNDNFHALNDALDMRPQQLVQLIKNGFEASFLPEKDKQQWLDKVDAMASASFQ